MTQELKNLPLSEIHRNPYQPRLHFKQDELEELAQSIKENGLIQPVIVRKSPILGYELIAGERRFRASQLANITTIPAIVKEVNDDDSMKLAIIENLQRSDLNPIEEAKAYQRLIEKNQLTHEEIATYMGKSRPYITNTLRLLNLPTPIVQSLENGDISQGHARCLLSLETEDAQLALHQRLLKEGLSVRQLEKLIKSKPNDKIQKKPNLFIRERETFLSQKLGLPVTITASNQSKGKLTISFNDLEEFNRIINKLS